MQGEDFARMHFTNQELIVKAKGIPVAEVKLSDYYSIILFSVYNFFVEAVVCHTNEEFKCIEKLTLDQVVDTYCDDVTFSTSY